jgi:hypothetical protein
MTVRPVIAASDFDPQSVHPPEQLPGHVVWPWVPACAGTNGRECAPFRAGDCNPHSVHPRGSGDPGMCRTRATKIRSSPRTRGPRATQSDSHIPGWIPAFAGMNGVRCLPRFQTVRPRTRVRPPAGPSAGSSGDPEQLPGHVVWPWVPACAGTNGREYAPFGAGDCDPHSVHPRGSGDPGMCRAHTTKIRSSPRTRGPRSTQSDSHIPGWIPAFAGMNGARCLPLPQRGFAFREAGA